MTARHIDKHRAPETGAMGWPVLFEQPQVHIHPHTGTMSVEPRDIFLSRRGQEEMAKCLRVMRP